MSDADVIRHKIIAPGEVSVAAASAALDRLVAERDAQEYRAEQHLRAWVESSTGRERARAEAAEAERDEALHRLEAWEAFDWQAHQDGSLVGRPRSGEALAATETTP